MDLRDDSKEMNGNSYLISSTEAQRCSVGQKNLRGLIQVYTLTPI